VYAKGFLTVKHNTENKAIHSVLLAHFEADGETSWIVTAYKTLVCCFEPETKVNPWNGTILNLTVNE
jgi:hypothetical protein